MTSSSRSSRRTFLAAAAAAAGASFFDLSKILAEHVPGPQRKYGWFPMGIQSYSLRGYPVNEALSVRIRSKTSNNT